MSKFFIGVSGAQGAGKSSLLIELQDRGWAIDKFRVSRAVQAELGWESLDRVMESPETMMAFQEEVFRQKYLNDLSIKAFASQSVVLTERTFADICAYTYLWTHRFLDGGQISGYDAHTFLVSYSRKCALAQAEIYDGVLMLPMMDHVVWEADANRADLKDVTEVFQRIEHFMSQGEPSTVQRLVITAKSIQERADQVQTFLRSL
jgi:predicted ATPase